MRNSKLFNFFDRYPIIILGGLFVLCMVLTVFQLERMQREMIRTAAIEQAAHYSEAISIFRNIYTSEITGRVKDHGIEITHEYADRDAAIPLPATMSMLLGNAIADTESGGAARLYSNYPFPWRTEEGGPQDPFEVAALEALEANPDQAYFEILDSEDGQVVRYATANVMAQGCVDCHNTHPESPIKNWEVGDVRGAMSVTIPVDAVVTTSRRWAQNIIVLVGSLSLLALIAAWIVLNKKRIDATDLEARVEQRTAQLRASENELRQAKHAAEDASRLKDEFLANMSHELRTPLMAIIANSQLLQQRGYSPEATQQKLKVVESSGDHLLSIINDILDISKMEAGKFEINPILIDVHSVCRESLDFVQATAIKKNLRIKYYLDPQVKAIVADPLRLRQSLINLLSNAVKFTPERGQVGLNVQATNEGIAKFMVWDTGIGMKEDDLKHLFKPFQQLDGGLARQFEGTGLGLSLVKHMAEMHGGAVTVVSKHEQGSCFTMELPWQYGLELPNEKSAAFAMSKTVAMGANGMPGAGYNGNSSTPIQEDPPEYAPLSIPRPPEEDAPLLLMVDDNASNTDVLSEFAELWGYRAKTASSGEECLAYAQSIRPHLIVLDIQMPGMDGFETMKRLKQNSDTRHIPVICVTGLAMKEDEDKILASGAMGYLPKPIDMNKLKAKIAEIIGPANPHFN